jgi:hypothetical protein
LFSSEAFAKGFASTIAAAFPKMLSKFAFESFSIALSLKAERPLVESLWTLETFPACAERLFTAKSRGSLELRQATRQVGQTNKIVGVGVDGLCWRSQKFSSAQNPKTPIIDEVGLIT